MTMPSSRVHLWCTNPDELADRQRYLAARLLLAPGEADRLTRYHFEADQRAFLATRALVRTTLSNYVDVAPTSWNFAAEDGGRPVIDGPSLGFPLHFSLSRTRRLVVCAVTSRGEVGVDAECADRSIALESFEALTPMEAAALGALPAEKRSERFLEYWTLKEAYAKARGLGLSIPLNRLNFVLPLNAPPRIEIDAALGDDGDSWNFAKIRPTSDHLVALCLRRDGEGPIKIDARWISFGANP